MNGRAIAAIIGVITLIAMVIVAVLVALVVDSAARRAQQAAQARTEASLLASYARIVLTHPQPLDRLLEKVKENFGMASVALLERRNGDWHLVSSAGTPTCAEPEDADVDVPVTDDVHLALRGHPLPAADRTVLEAAAGQALLTLRQQRTAIEAAEANQRAEANQLRTALLSAVGHDLRTPLTSIKAAIGSLRSPAWSTTCSTPPACPPAPCGPNFARSATTRSSPAHCPEWTSRCGSRSMSTSTCRTWWPTPACWSGSWPTSSTTPYGTACWPPHAGLARTAAGRSRWMSRPSPSAPAVTVTK